MERNHIISKSSKNNSNKENYLLKNIFDENFLIEKDKALSPVILSDEIPEETTKKALKEIKNKGTTFNANEEKYIKYGSDIVYIDSKIDENNNDENYCEIINEQIKNIIIELDFCKSKPKRRRIRKKI